MDTEKEKQEEEKTMGASGVGFQGPDGTTYNAYIFALGSSTPGVAVTASTTAPTSSPSWFIESPGSVASGQYEIFRFATQAEQRFAFYCQSNPSGPFTFNIKLADNSGTPVIQQGLLYLQVWDVALQRNKCTLLTIDAASAAASGTAGNIQQRLAYTFAQQGTSSAWFITSPGDVVRLFFFPNTSQNGVYPANSVISLYCYLLSK